MGREQGAGKMSRQPFQQIKQYDNKYFTMQSVATTSQVGYDTINRSFLHSNNPSYTNHPSLPKIILKN